MADPKAISDIARWFRDSIKTHPFLSEYHEFGTIPGPVGYISKGGLCVRNFQEGVFPKAEKLAPEVYMDELAPQRGTCHAYQGSGDTNA